MNTVFNTVFTHATRPCGACHALSPNVIHPPLQGTYASIDDLDVSALRPADASSQAPRSSDQYAVAVSAPKTKSGIRRGERKGSVYDGFGDGDDAAAAGGPGPESPAPDAPQNRSDYAVAMPGLANSDTAYETIAGAPLPAG